MGELGRQSFERQFGRAGSFEGQIREVEELGRAWSARGAQDDADRTRAALRQRLRDLNPELAAQAKFEKAVDPTNPNRSRNERVIRSTVATLVPSALAGANDLRQQVAIDLLINGERGQRGLVLEGNQVTAVPGAKDFVLRKSTAQATVALQLDSPDEPLIATLAPAVTTGTMRAMQAELLEQRDKQPEAVNRYLETALKSEVVPEAKLAELVDAGVQPERPQTRQNHPEL